MTPPLEQTAQVTAGPAMYDPPFPPHVAAELPTPPHKFRSGTNIRWTITNHPTGAPRTTGAAATTVRSSDNGVAHLDAVDAHFDCSSALAGSAAHVLCPCSGRCSRPVATRPARRSPPADQPGK